MTKSRFKSNFNNAIRLIAFFLFGASIASIPIFSFNKNLYLCTWAIVGLMLADMCLFIVINKKVTIDITVVSLVLFSFSALISSVLNGLHGFNFTPILLPIATSIIYVFSKTAGASKAMLLSGFLGMCVFLIVFMIHYRANIISMNFNGRFGGDFGDENDIAILLGFGFSYAFFNALERKNIWANIVFFLLCVLFAFCGLLTGSKIFIFILLFVTVICIFLRLGKKRWWISCLIICGTIVGCFLLLKIPVFSAIRYRLEVFLKTFLGVSGSSSRLDYSSIFRLYMFQDGIEMFLRKPFFGFGIWGFATYGGLNNGWSHNHFSEGLCNFGLMGFILFHVPFFSSLFDYFCSKDKKQKNESFVLLLFFLISMISLSFFTQKIYAFISAPVFASFAHKRLFIFRFSGKERNGL